ncbi:MAG: pyridoxal-phosphate dependent enzyme [Planctomycetota bacterium]
MTTVVPIEPDMSLADAVTIDDVRSAARTIRPYATRTPVMTSRTLDARTGASVFLKCENFQRVGAFKFRGACNALSRLADDAPGVLTYSSGNHAQGIALASSLLSKRAVIVMPNNAPALKLAATCAYVEIGRVIGSRVVTYDPADAVREELGAEIADQEGLLMIPPYDHPDVIAGQGTAALELIEDHGPLDALFVCVGGGGLISGSAIVARALIPGCRVVGVEPSLADDAARSFRDRRLHTVRNPATIADGARTPHLGRFTFPIVLSAVDEMMTVTDDQLRSEMKFCFERLKLVVEPAGVLGLSGLLSDPRRFERKRVGVILSGGNVDADEFSSIVGDTE